MTSMGAAVDPKRQRIHSLGLASLTADEKEILSWSHEKRLEEFQKVNEGVDRHALQTKLMFIDSITVDNSEILEILKLSPRLSWEKVRDVVLSGPVDGYTSTFHSLDDINYPEHFWKAIIENQRERLTTNQTSA
jgi:hypothetical protein